MKICIKGPDIAIFDLIDDNSKKFLLPSTKEHLDLFAKGACVSFAMLLST
jgi:hypothetical protein